MSKSSSQKLLTENGDNTELLFTNYKGVSGLQDTGNAVILYHHDLNSINRNFKLNIDNIEKFKIDSNKSTLSNGLVIANEGLRVGKKLLSSTNESNGVIIYDSQDKTFKGRKSSKWINLGGVGIGITSSYSSQQNGTILYDTSSGDIYGKADGIWKSLTRPGDDATAYELISEKTFIRTQDPNAYSSGGKILHKVENLDKVRFTGNNIGIGTTSPSQKLHIVGNLKVDGSILSSGNLNIINTNTSTAEHLSVTNDGIGPAMIIKQTGSEVIANFKKDNTSNLTILNGGNVGIGISSGLNEKLEISGALKIGSNTSNTNGIIAYHDGDFKGYKDGRWNSLSGQSDYVISRNKKSVRFKPNLRSLEGAEVSNYKVLFKFDSINNLEIGDTFLITNIYNLGNIFSTSSHQTFVNDLIYKYYNIESINTSTNMVDFNIIHPIQNISYESYSSSSYSPNLFKGNYSRIPNIRNTIANNNDTTDEINRYVLPYSPYNHIYPISDRRKYATSDIILPTLDSTLTSGEYKLLIDWTTEFEETPLSEQVLNIYYSTSQYDLTNYETGAQTVKNLGVTAPYRSPWYKIYGDLQGASGYEYYDGHAAANLRGGKLLKTIYKSINCNNRHTSSEIIFIKVPQGETWYIRVSRSIIGSIGNINLAGDFPYTSTNTSNWQNANDDTVVLRWSLDSSNQGKEYRNLGDIIFEEIKTDVVKVSDEFALKDRISQNQLIINTVDDNETQKYITLSTSNTERLRIVNNNLGIGVKNPQEKLVVDDNLAVVGSLNLENDAGTKSIDLRGPSGSYASNVTYTLPGQINDSLFLKTDSSGNTSWSESEGIVKTATDIGTSTNNVVGTFDSIVSKNLNLKNLEKGEQIFLTSTDTNTIRISINSKANEIFNDESGSKTSLKVEDDGNNGNIRFNIDNNELIRINQNGVGINTNNIGQKLDIKGTIKYRGSTSGEIKIKAPESGANATYTFPGVVGSSQNGKYLLTDSSGNLSWDTPTVGEVKAVSIIRDDTIVEIDDQDGTIGGEIIMKTDNTENIRLTSSGRLGIGITNPGEKLEVINGIRINDTSGTNNGIIKFDGSDFFGRKNGSWKTLTSGGVDSNGNSLISGNLITTGNDVSIQGSIIFETKGDDKVLSLISNSGNLIESASNNLLVVRGDTKVNINDSGNGSKLEYIIDGDLKGNFDNNGLQINQGAIKISDSNSNINGVIRYNNDDLVGYSNGLWKKLTGSSANNQGIINITGNLKVDSNILNLQVFEIDSKTTPNHFNMNIIGSHIMRTSVNSSSISKHDSSITVTDKGNTDESNILVKVDDNNKIKYETSNTLFYGKSKINGNLNINNTNNNVVINNNGNIFLKERLGIGITTPDSGLHLSGSDTNAGIIHFGKEYSSNPVNPTVGNGGILYEKNNGELYFGSSSINEKSISENISKIVSNNSRFVVEDTVSQENIRAVLNDNNRVIINNNGTGIGKNTPEGDLDVSNLIYADKMGINNYPITEKFEINGSIKVADSVDNNSANGVIRFKDGEFYGRKNNEWLLLNDGTFNGKPEYTNKKARFSKDIVNITNVSNGSNQITVNDSSNFSVGSVIYINGTGVSNLDDRYHNITFKSGNNLLIDTTSGGNSTNGKLQMNYTDFTDSIVTAGNEIVLLPLSHSLQTGNHHIYITWVTKFNKNPLDNQILKIYYKNEPFNSPPPPGTTIRGGSNAEGSLLSEIYLSSMTSEQSTTSSTVFINVPEGETYYLRWTRSSEKQYRWGDDIGDISLDDFNVHYTTPSAISAFTNKIYKNNNSLSVVDIGNNDGYMLIKLNGDSKLRINKDGLGFGTDNPNELLSLQSQNNSLVLVNTTNNNGHSGLLLSTNSGGDGNIFLDDGDSQKLKFAFNSDLTTQSNRESNTKFSITQAGVVNSNNSVSFTGGHLCITKEQYENLDNPRKYNLDEYENKIGFIVRSIGKTYNISNDLNINERLPIIELSQRMNDTSSFGVIVKKNNLFNDIPRLIINSVGEGAIMVSNFLGDISNGDYITTSPIPGIGMKQTDGILYSYTVAKALTNENFENNYNIYTYNNLEYKYKLIACTYHCG